MASSSLQPAWVQKGCIEMSVARVPQVLRARLGHDGANALEAFLESSRDQWTDEVMTTAMERFEHVLTRELSMFRLEVARDIAALRQDFSRDLSTVRVETFKWSFVFWVGQVAVMVGLLAFAFRR